MYRRKRTPAQASPTQSEPALPVRTYPKLTLTVEEMADELNISGPIAYTLVKAPDFPSFRIGRRILVDREALQGWITRQSSQPLDETA